MDKLEFDEKSHSYTINGRRLISVTQALAVVDTRYKIDPWYLKRGEEIHKATAIYDRGEFDKWEFDTRISGFIESYIKFRRNTNFEPVMIEQGFYHPQYFYAGTLDRQGPLNGDSVIIDIKSGAKSDVDELQQVAYWELCRVNNVAVKKIFDLYLKENGDMANLVPIENPKKHLLQVFLSCLKIAQWKEGL